MPVWSLGLTPARSVSRLLLVTLWSRRSEYRSVRSETGKLPTKLFRGTKEAGTKQFAVGGGHEVGKPLKPPKVAGQAPFNAIPEEDAASAVYCPTSCPNSGLRNSRCSTAGLVRNPTCCGVSSTVPNGWPTCVVLNGTNPKLLAPIEENPVSCRQVPS